MNRTVTPITRFSVLLRRTFVLLAASCLVTGTSPVLGQDAGEGKPVSGQSRELVIRYLLSITGKYILAGQQDGPNTAPTTWHEQVHKMTGRYPAIWAGDFGFEKWDVAARANLVSQAKTAWAAGSIPMLSWHACPPTVGDDCHWNYGEGAIRKPLSDAQWTELLTDGSALNRHWKQRLDEIVPLLKELKNSGIPVLFRPHHEMNEDWSWWGGRPGDRGSRRLYQITHDYLASGKELNNLIWVWNVKDLKDGSTQAPDFWPGPSYVDVASLDVWINKQPTQQWYDALVSIAVDKPIGLAEVGTIPPPEMISAQPRWTFFAIWRGWLADPKWNDPDLVRRTYFDRRVLARGDIHIPDATNRQRRQ